MSRQCRCGGVIRQHELVDNRMAWACGSCGRYEAMSMNREQLREAMPTVASVVDEFRALMADGGKVVYASENGHVIDRREPEENVFQVPTNYFPTRQIERKDRK